MTKQILSKESGDDGHWPDHAEEYNRQKNCRVNGAKRPRKRHPPSVYCLAEISQKDHAIPLNIPDDEGLSSQKLSYQKEFPLSRSPTAFAGTWHQQLQSGRNLRDSTGGSKEPWSARNTPRRLRLCSSASLCVQEFLGSICEKYVISANIDNTFILAPEERPILFVLQKVRFQQKHSGDDSPRNE